VDSMAGIMAGTELRLLTVVSPPTVPQLKAMADMGHRPLTTADTQVNRATIRSSRRMEVTRSNTAVHLVPLAVMAAMVSHIRAALAWALWRVALLWVSVPAWSVVRLLPTRFMTITRMCISRDSVSDDSIQALGHGRTLC